MAEGLQIRLTHTGVGGSTVILHDIRDSLTTEVSSEYYIVPAPSVGNPNPFIVVTYGGSVPLSFERGDIRRNINRGYLTAEFLLGDLVLDAVTGLVAITASAGGPSPDVYTATRTDMLFLVDTTLDAINIQLCSGSSHVMGVLRVVDVGGNASANPVTLLASPSDTIKGNSSYTLSFDNQRVDLAFGSGSNWFFLGVEPDAGAPLIVDAVATPYNVPVKAGYVLVNPAVAAPFVVNLPAGATHLTKTLIVKDKKGMGLVNNITINANGGETIDGAGSAVIDGNYAALSLVFSGTEWSLI